MAWAAGTNTNMTVVGAELVLDEMAPFGSHETTAVDMGRIDAWLIVSTYTAAANPAGSGYPKVVHEIAMSDDNITYSAWAVFRSGVYNGRYYKLKITVYGDIPLAVLPKLTQFEHAYYEPNTEPVWPRVEGRQNSPPVAPVQGQNWLVETGAGAWLNHNGERALCIETSVPTWRYIHPRQGQHVYVVDEDLDLIYNGSAWRDTRPFPVGSVFVSVVATDPATLLGYGTWSTIGAGRVLVGQDVGDADFDTLEETGGAKTHTHAVGSIAPNAHTGTAVDAHAGTAVADHAAHTHPVPGSASVFSAAGSGTDVSLGTHEHTTENPSATLTHSVTQPNAHNVTQPSDHTMSGSTAAGSNVSPYLVVIFWKRTA